MKSEIINLCCQHHQPFEQCPTSCGYADGYFYKLECRRKRLALEAEKEEKKRIRLEKTIPCARCGKPHYSQHGGLYCSSRCRYEPVVKTPKPITPCKVCGNPINRYADKYCSKACCNKGRHREWKCVSCGKETAPQRKYCSKECRPKKESVKKVAKPKPPKIKECPLCHTQHTRLRLKYCSDQCTKKADNIQRKQTIKKRKKRRSEARIAAFTPQERQCPHCAKCFTTTLETSSKVYCSRRCGRRFGAAKNRRDNPHQKIKDRLSGRLRDLLKQKGLQKKSPVASYFGMTPKELQAHIESQFTDGMTGDNYGVFGWHVDHYIPCQKFDLANEEHVKVCFNWRNLRPLWGAENTKRQHWLSVDDRLFMDAELYTMAKAIGISV